MIDFRPIHREMAEEAIEGVIYQLEGALRFLDRGADAETQAALGRAAHLFREAAKPMGELLAENRRRETVALREAA